MAGRWGEGRNTGKEAERLKQRWQIKRWRQRDTKTETETRRKVQRPREWEADKESQRHVTEQFKFRHRER